MAVTRDVLETDTRYNVECREANSVVGRATLIKSVPKVGQARLWAIISQGFGGAAEGTFDKPVKCDIEVLRAFVAAADELP